MKINEVNVFMIGNNNRYSAKGTYIDGKIIIKKGSKISEIRSTNRIAKIVIATWKEKLTVDDSKVLLRDVLFDSPTSAAQFVAGYNVNGKTAWKVAKGQSLKDFIKKYGEFKNN